MRPEFFIRLPIVAVCSLRNPSETTGSYVDGLSAAGSTKTPVLGQLWGVIDDEIKTRKESESLLLKP